jgi:hypothetical protein
LERLLACHTFIHLIRTIGHHIDRLACRSVSIMSCLSANLVKTLFAKPRISAEQSVWDPGPRSQSSMRRRAGVRGEASPVRVQRQPMCHVPNRLAVRLIATARYPSCEGRRLEKERIMAGPCGFIRLVHAF